MRVVARCASSCPKVSAVRCLHARFAAPSRRPSAAFNAAWNPAQPLLLPPRSLAPWRAEDTADEEGPQPYCDAKVADLARQRGGWLFVFSFGLVLAATIVQDFDALIAQHVELSFFVPLIIGHGGNSGSQTSSALVRALALKQVCPKSAPEVIVKEASAGCMMGAALGLFILGLTLTTHCFSSEVGLVVAISLPVISLWANGLGAALTLTSAKLRLDPGLTSAPLVTTIVDTTGLIIYFSIAQAIISPESFLTTVVADNAVMAALAQPPGT